MQTRNPYAIASALISLSVLTATVPALAAPTIIDIPQPKSSEWTQTVLQHIGEATVTAITTDSAFRPNELGFWTVSYLNITPKSVSSDTLALIYDQFTWEPDKHGGIDVIELSADLGRVGSTFSNGSAGFVRPVVMQGGAIYSVLGSDIEVGTAFMTIGLDPLSARPIYPTAHWSLSATANWVRGDGATGLDLSATGDPIRFGVRWGLATNCPSVTGCSAAATVTQIDNLKFSIQSVTAVPEPETYAMLLAGLGLVAAVARRRKTHANGVRSSALLQEGS